MAEKKESWFAKQIKGLNIWVIILIVTFICNVVLVPVISRVFATQQDIRSVTENVNIKIELTEKKIEDIRKDIQTIVQNIDKSISKNSDKMDDIYKILINMRRR